MRIHLSDLGFPILGDKLYGREGMILKGKGLFLCAVELTFGHPFLEEEMNFKIEPPNKFRLFMKKEKRMHDKFLQSS